MPIVAEPAADPVRYDPWHDLATNWPELVLRVAPLPGRLLGEVRYPVITLRAGTSAAQRRCTLAHEIVHLERGLSDCGPWSHREEALVHAQATRRLIRLTELAAALRAAGGDGDPGRLAQALDVDRQTAALRIALLTPGEQQWLRARLPEDSWHVA